MRHGHICRLLHRLHILLTKTTASSTISPNGSFCRFGCHGFCGFSRSLSGQPRRVTISAGVCCSCGSGAASDTSRVTLVISRVDSLCQDHDAPAHWFLPQEQARCRVVLAPLLDGPILAVTTELNQDQVVFRDLCCVQQYDWSSGKRRLRCFHGHGLNGFTPRVPFSSVLWKVFRHLER